MKEKKMKKLIVTTPLVILLLAVLSFGVFALNAGDTADDGVIVSSQEYVCTCCHSHSHSDTTVGRIACFLCRVKQLFRKEKSEVLHKYTIVSKTENGGKRTYNLKCVVCKKTNTFSEETYSDKSKKKLLVHYKISGNKVIDLVSGDVMEGAVIDGEYFRGGKVVLPSSITKGTLEAVMNYNRLSFENPTGNGLSYYGGTFLMREINGTPNKSFITAPFGGGQIETNYTFHPTINNLNDKTLPDGDSFWCLAFDKEKNLYSLTLNDDYHEKSHWASYFNKTFTLSSEHRFKEVKVYSEMLTKDNILYHYRNTKTSSLPEGAKITGRITDGITDLGPAFAFTKKVGSDVPQWKYVSTAAGKYKVSDGNGLHISYEIENYVHPDLGIDNSKYESVHIIKKPKTVYVGYKFALSAFPYPFNVNHSGKSDQFDVTWKSSNTEIASVIDGLLIAKKPGTVTITATLTGTTKKDTCKITIAEKEKTSVKKIFISEDYISENGNRFSDTDYEMTTRAIFDAIDEAFFSGYNHIIFPKIVFYAAPTGETYYIPTGMTVEFPKGSVFRMMPTEFARTKGYHYFSMGWPTWDNNGYFYNKPVEKAKTEYNSLGVPTGYFCEDAHLIVDKYYGEFYDENADQKTLSERANEYKWGCTFASCARNSRFCTIEIHHGECTTGFYMLAGGKTGSQELKGYDRNNYQISVSDFTKGRYDDSGKIVSNKNWYSINKFYPVLSGVDGTDILHSYYLGDWQHNVSVYTEHFYDILWFDKDKKIIKIDRFNFTDEIYEKPDGAAYFKISMQMSSLPENSLTDYIQLHPAMGSYFCEIRNTNIINGADGLASIVGESENLWIHDNYISSGGLLDRSCWGIDSEDGWLGIRGTIFEHNILRKYTFNSRIGDYTGPDTGTLSVTSGFNTFVVSNYLGAFSQSGNNAVCTHLINNVVYTRFSRFVSGTEVDINSKVWAHCFYNYMSHFPNENTTANGKVYSYGNFGVPNMNYW